MQKPLFRFTVGATTQQGLDILEESVFRTMRALGETNWDWMICYNNLNSTQQEFLKYIVQGRPISLYPQSWTSCPVDDHIWSPVKPDGSIEVDGSNCGGTMWKVCPARLRYDSHEIIMDNDIIILKQLPQIEQFLSSIKRTLILEEPIRYYGRYANLISFDDRMNSGIIGLPPNYDFGKEIRKSWEENSKHTRITQEDEQGLLTYTLQKQPNIRIPKEDVRELLADDSPRTITNENGIHFCQANRTDEHKTWQKYKEQIMNSIQMV